VRLEPRPEKRDDRITPVVKVVRRFDRLMRSVVVAVSHSVTNRGKNRKDGEGASDERRDDHGLNQGIHLNQSLEYRRQFLPEFALHTGTRQVRLHGPKPTKPEKRRSGLGGSASVDRFQDRTKLSAQRLDSSTGPEHAALEVGGQLVGGGTDRKGLLTLPVVSVDRRENPSFRCLPVTGPIRF